MKTTPNLLHSLYTFRNKKQGAVNFRESKSVNIKKRARGLKLLRFYKQQITKRISITNTFLSHSEVRIQLLKCKCFVSFEMLKKI